MIIATAKREWIVMDTRCYAAAFDNAGHFGMDTTRDTTFTSLLLILQSSIAYWAYTGA